MPPLTASVLSRLEELIDQIPEQTDAFGDQTETQKRKRTDERRLFRELVSKLAGKDKNEQTKFLIDQARKISRKTYVQITLESIPKPPDYAELDKKNRKTYAHVHKLIDKALHIAAGSDSLLSQKKVFENRCAFVHKERFLPSSTHFKELQTLIASLQNPEDLWQIVEQAIGLIPTECKDQDQDDESNLNIVTPEKRRKIVFTFLNKALNYLPVPPSYKSLSRTEKRKYRYIYQLIDKILPFAAGSSSSADQLDLLMNR